MADLQSNYGPLRLKSKEARAAIVQKLSRWTTLHS